MHISIVEYIIVVIELKQKVQQSASTQLTGWLNPRQHQQHSL